jgi:hypothetical protein
MIRLTTGGHSDGLVLPSTVLIGMGFGLSLAPSFSTGTLGLASATVNTAQQVGGSFWPPSVRCCG